jgi:hypothetical protein
MLTCEWFYVFLNSHKPGIKETFTLSNFYRLKIGKMVSYYTKGMVQLLSKNSWYVADFTFVAPKLIQPIIFCWTRHCSCFDPHVGNVNWCFEVLHVGSQVWSLEPEHKNEKCKGVKTGIGRFNNKYLLSPSVNPKGSIFIGQLGGW